MAKFLYPCPVLGNEDDYSEEASFTFEKEEEGSTYFNDLDIWKIHSLRENLMNDFQKILSFYFYFCL